MTPNPAIEPGPHLWDASALTNALFFDMSNMFNINTFKTDNANK